MSKSEVPTIIFLIRLFSAFERSVQESRWSPEGMPTVSKLWEKLSREEIPFEVYCTANTESFRGYQKIMMDELRTSFSISTPLLYGKWGIFQFMVNRLNSAWMKGRVFFRVLAGNENRIYYVDRENVVLGALLVLLGKKVVLRLHGVAVLYRKYNRLLDSLKTPLRKWAFKAPFSVIIATEDGSPVLEFIRKFTNSRVRREVLINGVNLEPDEYIDIRKKHTIKYQDPVILFVSRLVKGKGVEVFFKTIYKLLDDNHIFDLVIVGEGDLKDKYAKMSEKYRSIHFAGSVPHHLIMNYYLQSTIFVSLNKLGDLANTVLEAIGGESCIILLRTKHNSSHNESIDRLIQDNVQIIGAENIEKELYHSISKLLEDEKSQLDCIANGRRLKTSITKSWEERMDCEVNILTQIC